MVYAISEKVCPTLPPIPTSLYRGMKRAGAEDEDSATANANQPATSPTRRVICKRRLSRITMASVTPYLPFPLPCPNWDRRIPQQTKNKRLKTRLPKKQGFYRQIREIEAETGCRFVDTFLIDSERAIDYSKIWIETFQRVERPCAKLR